MNRALLAAMSILSCGPQMSGAYRGELHVLGTCSDDYLLEETYTAAWRVVEDGGEMVATTAAACSPLHGVMSGTTALLASMPCPAITRDDGSVFNVRLMTGSVTLQGSALVVSAGFHDLKQDPDGGAASCTSAMSGTLTRQP